VTRRTPPIDERSHRRTPRSERCPASRAARTISEALGFQGVAFNVYRPAWDDFIVSTVHGCEAMCEALLGETYDWSVWELPLQDRFERRGAYFIPHGMVDWSDPELGARYVPERATLAGEDAWVPGDELFVPCRHSDGHRIALEQLLQVSSRLSERRSIDEVLQEVRRRLRRTGLPEGPRSPGS
jgi:hypothetical protein